MPDCIDNAKAAMDSDPRYHEICRLWEQFRIADLNVRYYGALAQKRKRWSSGFQIAIAVFSLFAVVVLAAPELRASLSVLAAVSSGLATITAGALPFLGWDEDAKKYTFLNRSYQIVENQIREALTLMRREDSLSPEMLGRSKVLLDSMSRLQGFDEEEYSNASRKEKDNLRNEVDKAFPQDYIWNNL